MGGSSTVFKIGPFSACIYDDWRQRENKVSEANNIANAHLIAAAPDLLAACMTALKVVSELADIDSESRAGWAHKELDTAIAKAITVSI